MATSILAGDLTAICLHLADGDIGLSLEEVVGRAEAFQERHACHFGMSPEDVRSAFHMLVKADLGLLPFHELILDLPLKRVLPSMLACSTVHFNDEGEHWCKGLLDHTADAGEVERWHDYTMTAYRDRLRLHILMRDFFAPERIDLLRPDAVRAFMHAVEISEEVLHHCARSAPGS